MSTSITRYVTLQRGWLLIFLGVAGVLLLKPLWQLSVAFQPPPDVILADFYPVEQREQQEFRFSRAASRIFVPRVPAQPAALVFRVASIPSHPSRKLSITYDQQRAMVMPISYIPRVVRAFLPPSSSAHAQGLLVNLQTDTVSVAGDSRKLGLVFEDVHVQQFASNTRSFTAATWFILVGLTLAGASRTYYARIKDRMQRIGWLHPPVSDTLFLSVGMVLFCTLYAATSSSLSLLKQTLFLTNGYDLGIYDQTLWLLSQGKAPYNTTMGIHILGNHASFLVYILSLLYVVIPDVRALLILQSVAIAAGGWLIYKIGHDKQAPQAGAIIAVVYLLHPAVQNMNLFDFHPDALASTALIAAFWLAERRNWVWMFVACALVLIAKEHFALTMMAFSVYLLLRKNYYPGIILLVVSIAWFGFVTKIIEPSFNGLGRPVHMDRYSMYGNGIGGMLKTLVTQPNIFVAQLFDYNVAYYLLYLTLPFLFLCWFDLRTLIVAVPIVMLNILTDYDQQTGMQFHYDALVVPVLAVASLHTFVYCSKHVSKQFIFAAICSLGMLYGVITTKDNVRLGTSRMLELYDEQSERMLFYNYATSRIPPHARVSAQSRIQPHLTHGEQVFVFPAPFTSDSLVDPAGMPFIPDIEYIIYDSKERLSPYMPNDQAQDVLADIYTRYQYVPVVNLDGVTLMKRADVP